MDRQEWLNWRGVGSSDAPVIMKVVPENWHINSPYKLWEQRVTGKEVPVTYPMQRGIDMEETARKWFERKMGVYVFPKAIKHPELNWMTATLDGIDLDGKVCVELKCPKSKESHHYVEVNKKVPDNYYPQVQHQLEVTGLDGMFFCSFDGENGVIVEVARDQNYIDNMKKEEAIFWNCLINREPPELTERDCVNMDHEGQWRKLSQEWIAISTQLKELEQKEQQTRSELISLAKDRNAQGTGVRLTRSVTKGAIDYNAIPQLQGVNLEPYRKKSFTKWRASVL